MADHILEQGALLQRLDDQHCLGLSAALPRNIETIHRQSRSQRLNFDVSFDRVCLCGDADGLIAASLMRSILPCNGAIPITLSLADALPDNADRAALVIAMLTSGNSQQCERVIRAARSRGAHIICLVNRSAPLQSEDTPAVHHVTLPRCLQTPHGIHYGFIAGLNLLTQLGLAPDYGGQIDRAIRLLEELNSDYFFDVSVSRNPAKQLAARLYQSSVVVCGTEGNTDATAQRWTALLRRQRIDADTRVLPEMSDKTFPFAATDPNNERTLLILSNNNDPPHAGERITALASRAVDAGFGVIQYGGHGDTKLCRLISLNFLIDYVGCYLHLVSLAVK